jgi:hypothetical protein
VGWGERKHSLCFVKIRLCKSYESTPILMQQYPISLTLWIHSSWGWNKDRRVKLRPKDRVRFQISLLWKWIYWKFEIIHTRCLNIHSTQPIWIFSVYMMYKNCFLWEPFTLHPHGSFMNNLQNSWGQDSKRRKRALLLITSRKERKQGIKEHYTDWCSLLRRDCRTNTESTNSASASYLKAKYTQIVLRTQSKYPLNRQLPSAV